MPSDEVVEVVRRRAAGKAAGMEDALLLYLDHIEALGVEPEPGYVKGGQATGVHLFFQGKTIGWVYPGWGRRRDRSRLEFRAYDADAIASRFDDNVRVGEGNRPGPRNVLMEFRGASDISDAVALMTLVVEERKAGRVPSGLSSKGKEVPGSSVRKRRLGVPYVYRVPRPTTRDRVPFEVDPDQVDRGSFAHEETRSLLAEAVTRAGLYPREPDGEPQFDLAWMQEGHAIVAEVKSLLPQNEERQLRLGLGQVLRYRYQLATRFPFEVTAVLMVERQPGDPSWKELCDPLGVYLVWPDTMGLIFA